MTESTAVQDALIGTTLNDRFSVVSLISRGGLSVLYKGVDKTTAQDVTIRVLLSCRSDEEQSIARFNTAVKLMEGVRHASIVSIVGSGITDSGTPYLVMPFIEGKSVREKCKDTPMSFEDALPIIRDIGGALQYAHEHRIIHRNLKPSNVLLTNVNGTQRAVLTGFGIAKKAPSASGDSMSHTTKVIGSPLYMSPEQFINSKIDARSDIYSFGCVIHQMLSGVPPFEAPSLVQLMGAHHHNYRPHFPPHLNVPQYVEDILDAATLKMPGNRYQSVAQMVADFEAKKCSIDLRAARKLEPRAEEENVARQQTIKATAIITAGSVLVIALVIFIAGFDSFTKSHSPQGATTSAQAGPQALKKFIDAGQYGPAMEYLYNQLSLAEASGERTEVLHEKLGALHYLKDEMSQARDEYMQAIKVREGIVASEPDTSEAQKRHIQEDYAFVTVTYLNGNDNKTAAETALKHLMNPEYKSPPLNFAMKNLLPYFKVQDAKLANEVTDKFPEAFLPGQDVDKAQLDEYVINLVQSE
jgi:serine/threonine protein kinase